MACVALGPGLLKTRISDYTGDMSLGEAVKRMLKVIDAVDMREMANFYY